MGRDERANGPKRAALGSLRVVVDVQHAYRGDRHAGDRGAAFVLAGGTRIWEAQAARQYAFALCEFLAASRIAVLANDPAHGILIGPYLDRQRAAVAWGAHLYLACHVNAGRGSSTLTEALADSPGLALGRWIGKAMTDAFPALLSAETRPLADTDRGAVCVRGVPAPAAAVILEPFFGDNPAHQGMLAAPVLADVGRTIGRGVIDWWLARSLG